MRTLFARAAAVAALAAATASPARADTPAPAVATVANVHIKGASPESPDKLAAFLGLLRGAPADDLLQQRVADGLDRLGYLTRRSAWTPGPKGVSVHLELEPKRVVRHIDVHGNWPVFEEEVRRRLTLRPGSTLPTEADTTALLELESERVKEFLRRDGYFDCDVDLVIKPAGRPEWVDLSVLIYLGRWTRLGSVEATGSTILTPRELENQFSSNSPWWLGRFRTDQMREDARNAEEAYRQRGYPAARVIPEFDPQKDLDRRTYRTRVRLNVIEKGRVDLHFVGNHALTDKALREKITIFNAGSYDDVELGESARELHRFYQAHGFLEARVTWRRRRAPAPPATPGATPAPDADLQEITFFIDEGPVLKVRAVEFAPEPGTPKLAFDEAELRPLVATKVFPKLGAIGLGEGGFVTSLQLAQDAEKIAAWYRDRGYPDARARGEIARDPAALGQIGVISADLATHFGEGDVYVRFFVDEGHHEAVSSLEIRFSGPHGRTAAALAKTLKLASGSPYTASALRADLNRLTTLYANSGHPYVEIDANRSTWNEDHTRVRLVVSVDEGAEVRFGPILIRGNFRTAESVILSDLPFSPGDLFDASKLALAERNLQTHTIFNVVEVKTFSGGQSPIPILVRLQERYDDYGTIVGSLGYATDIGLSETIGYFWGNAFGGGGQIELRGEAAEDFGQVGNDRFWRLLSASLRYVHPHLFFPSLRGEIQGVIRQENTARLGVVLTQGFSLSLSWVASPALRLFGRYDFTNSSLQSIEFQRLPGRGDDKLATVQDQTTTGKLTGGVVFDDRTSFLGARNPLLPVEGWLLAFTAALALKPLAFSYLGLEHTHNFLVLSGQVQRYQPISGDIRLIANVRGDWGFPFDEPALPAVERFFAGGDTTTRGFATDRLKTEVIRGDVSPAPGVAGYRIIPQGGNVRFLATLELQFPIGELFGFPWVGAVFADAGTIFDTPALFEPTRDLKVSVGVTLFRILTPFGPLSFEYAYPLTQSLAEEEWKRNDWYAHWPGRIHFNWGIPILR